jgi:HAD superfamily hydrolase (TIGR01509 family)
MSWDAIIFDCDGTLVDSERLGNEVLVGYLEQLEVSLTVDEALARFHGVHMAECVAQIEAIRGTPLPETFVAELRARMVAAFTERLRPIEGAAVLVRSLTVPYCMASSGPREKIELSLSLTGLLPLFEGAIFSSYETGQWKPDPGLFLHAASALGVDPGRCAVVEDSLPGIRAGLAAGMSVFALQPYGRDPLIPDRVRSVANLGELLDVFREAKVAI